MLFTVSHLKIVCCGRQVVYYVNKVNLFWLKSNLTTLTTTQAISRSKRNDTSSQRWAQENEYARKWNGVVPVWNVSANYNPFYTF